MNVNEILKTEESKISFLIGLVFLSKIDGVVDETEKIFFTNAATALALSNEGEKRVYSSWDEEEMPELNFANKKEKLFFLMQAIQLSNVDNEYSEKERSFIYNVASDQNISEESVRKIENWVKQGIKWQADGEKLLDLEA